MLRKLLNTIEQLLLWPTSSKLVDTANAPIFGIDKLVTSTSGTKSLLKSLLLATKPSTNLWSIHSLYPFAKTVQEVFDNALKGQGTSNHELEFRTKSNEIPIPLVNATTRRDRREHRYVVGVAQDVTEAVKRDHAVNGIANELRQLVDTANAPILVSTSWSTNE
jgi:hypothetical protein